MVDLGLSAVLAALTKQQHRSEEGEGSHSAANAQQPPRQHDKGHAAAEQDDEGHILDQPVHRAQTPVFLCSQLRNWATVLSLRIDGFALVAAAPARLSAEALMSAMITRIAVPTPRKCAA